MNLWGKTLQWITLDYVLDGGPLGKRNESIWQDFAVNKPYYNYLLWVNL